MRYHKTIVEKTPEYTIFEYDDGDRWMEIPNYRGDGETEYFREYDYKKVIRGLGQIPFTGYNVVSKEPYPDTVFDEEIEQCLRDKKFIEDMDLVYSSDGAFDHNDFKASKIATIVNAIQNNEYKYHLFSPSWYVYYFDEDEHDITDKVDVGELDERYDVDEIEFEDNGGGCCIRAFIYCKKNIFARPLGSAYPLRPLRKSRSARRRAVKARIKAEKNKEVK
jgi:hypothetical protein